jgi:hypothetical protein
LGVSLGGSVETPITTATYEGDFAKKLLPDGLTYDREAAYGNYAITGSDQGDSISGLGGMAWARILVRQKPSNDSRYRRCG